MKRAVSVVILVLGIAVLSFSQAPDSVDVTFYYKATSSATVVYLPGDFNGWGHNVGGVIPANDPCKMAKDPATGYWWKTVRLAVGGNPSGTLPGSWQYKFNENGNVWLADPRNPRHSSDNGNSVLYVNSPTIEYLLPNSTSGVVSQQYPIVSAYIFPSLLSTLDTTTISVSIDSAAYAVPSSAYDPSSRLLTFKSPIPVSDGSHTIKLSAKNFGSGMFTSDSATIIVLGGDIRILNRSSYATIKDSVVIYAAVEDTGIHAGELISAPADTQFVSFSGGSFSANIPLKEGLNTFVMRAIDSTGSPIQSSSFSITRMVIHAPNAQVDFTQSSGSIALSATGSTDPDSGETASLTFSWSADSGNPATLPGVDGATSSTVDVTTPTAPGDYTVQLIATDNEGNKDTTRSYFTINTDGSVSFPTLTSDPDWVKRGRIYEIFFNSFTPQQTINAATRQLDYLRRLGVNILWIMPVMENNGAIDNGAGPGYNIIDFYTVAPQYGTNADFKNFVQQAHQLGMHVILDVTPNHTSVAHPFVQDAKLYGKGSYYWTFYQHQSYTANTNYHPDLPESMTSDGFFFYDGWDQLMNWNWADADARAYMIGVYEWWIKEMGVDGYRFDVYWGPHARTDGGNGGEIEMGLPVRTALKHIDPSIFLLGEASGTGPGTEAYYADDAGGVDAAYDWNLLHNVVTPYNISALNTNVTNYGGDTMGFVPGPNSRFMRFLENHDEDRIAYVYNSYVKTMPMGTMIFTVPGIPMIYSGQEVGFGLGITNYDQRRRGIIDWNSAGKSLLSPHYQRLAWIRATYPAFSTLKFRRLSAGNAMVYAYTRPYLDQNGIAVENFNGFSMTSSIALTGTGSAPNVSLTGGPVNGKTYYLNDVYNDTSYAVSFMNDTLKFSATLPAYGSAVYILADSMLRLTVPLLTSVNDGGASSVASTFMLEQNFPNPFNPTTNIVYSLPQRTNVMLRVYNILGQVVRELVDGWQTAGNHVVTFNAGNLASGVYFYRLEAGSLANVKKMVLMK